MLISFRWGNLKERGDFVTPDVEARITKLILKEVREEIVDWIYLAQDGDK